MLLRQRSIVLAHDAAGSGLIPTPPMSYNIVKIPKGKGKFRTIYVPDDVTKHALQACVPSIAAAAAQADRHNVQHGFTRGRSPVTNALAHVGWQYSLTMDLKDFFDSVIARHVQEFLVTHTAATVNEGEAPRICIAPGIHPSWGVEVSKLFPDGAARQGLPTSPALANLAAAPLDNDIMALRKSGRFTSFVFTRYCDDLTFSFNNPDLADFLKEKVRELVEKHGFKLNDRKTKLQCAKAGARMITGVAVTSTGIQIPRAVKRQIRAGTHQLQTRQLSRRNLRRLLSRLQEIRRTGKTVSLYGLLVGGHRGLTEWARLKPPKRPRESQSRTTATVAAQVRTLGMAVWRSAASLFREFD